MDRGRLAQITGRERAVKLASSCDEGRLARIASLGRAVKLVLLSRHSWKLTFNGHAAVNFGNRSDPTPNQVVQVAHLRLVVLGLEGEDRPGNW